jgi:hypothetical protein
VIILHHTMAQFQPPVAPPLPPITTLGDYIARLHPFLQALIPAIDTLGHDFTVRAIPAAADGILCTRTRGPPNIRAHNLQLDWSIHNDTNSANSLLVQHRVLLPCRPEESRTKRGIQLGLIAIHIITAALESIGIRFEAIKLDTTSHQILDRTKYTAPRQGYSCLANPSTDVGKEFQNWTRTNTTNFTEPETPTDRSEESDSEDDTPQCRTRHATNDAPPTTVTYPPASKYKLTVDALTYNYLPESLLRERHHLPLFKKFLKDKCDLETKSIDDIAWEVTAQAINTLNIT